MTLNAPSQTMFIVSVVIAVIALLGSIVTIPFVSAYAVWIMLLGFVVLAAAVLMKGA